ncbi:ArsR/SmtB family transcription factor [Streptomyces sp. NPDC055966]|uniref:ArsR/SmtB family transcription factor n=1 Tax=Streptomyces sp. NPDC055966 TaxID=3345669 RepID=UPI0035D5430C
MDTTKHPLRHAIDESAVSAAVAGIGERSRVNSLAARFALLAEPGRLALLLAMHRAGPISVTDLALATGMRDTTVSHALRLLRTAGTVSASRTGRVVRYQLNDPEVVQLLDGTAGSARADVQHQG